MQWVAGRSRRELDIVDEHILAIFRSLNQQDPEVQVPQQPVMDPEALLRGFSSFQRGKHAEVEVNEYFKQNPRENPTRSECVRGDPNIGLQRIEEIHKRSLA